MEIIDTKNLIGGWFVGNFSPTAFVTEHCEVAYKHHFPNEDWPEHYHERTDEINYLLTGKMEINGQKIEGPCIFIIRKGEVAKPKFLTTVALIVVRVPGIPNDKFLVNKQEQVNNSVVEAMETLKPLQNDFANIMAGRAAGGMTPKRKRRGKVGEWVKSIETGSK